MSECISSHGEHSEHEFLPYCFTCRWCGVRDEGAMMTSFDRTARMVAKMQVTTTMLEEAMKAMVEAMTRYSRAKYGDGDSND